MPTQTHGSSRMMYDSPNVTASDSVQAGGANGMPDARYDHAATPLQDGRVLFIETSSLPHYDLTRKFYVKQGYDTAAVLKDYYSDGDDMVVFSKPMVK